MLASVFGLITQTAPPETTVPSTVAPTTTTSAPPTTDPPVVVTVVDDDGEAQGIVPSIRDVVVDVWDNLGENGYQTGVSLIAATIAVIIMRNLKVKNYIQAPVTAGAFWAGWLLWNTVAGENNPLFPGDISATKIWDVALSDQWGFLTAVAAGCIAAIALWRSSQSNAIRAVLITGTVFGASLVYNLVESVRITSA